MRPLTRDLFVNWTLVALAFVALLAVALTNEAVTSSEAAARERHLFTTLAQDKVSRIELSGNSHLVVVRGAGDGPRFRIIQPIQAEAEPASVDRLLQNIGFAVWLRRVDAGAKKDLGLDPPEQVIRLQVADAWHELRLGAEAPSPTGARYLEVTGSQFANPGVFVVSASVARDLSVSADEFRVWRLVPYLASELSRVELHSEGATHSESKPLALEKTQQGGWRFAEQFSKSRADRDTMERFFLELSRTQSDDFFPVGDARKLQAARPQTQPLVHLTLVPNGHGLPNAKITLGGACPRDPARTLAVRTAPEPIAACVDARVVNALVERPELLLDPRLFQLRSDEVEELSIERAAEPSKPVQRLELARRGDGFILRAPKSAEVARQAGQERLQAVLDVRGEWLDTSSQAFALKEPLKTVSLTQAAVHEETATTERVQLSEVSEDGFVYARREMDGAVLRLDRRAAHAFEIDASMIRSRELFSLDRDDLRQVTLEWAGQRQVLKQTARAEFSLVEPTGFEADAGLSADLIDALRTLSVVRWVSDRSVDPLRIEPSKVDPSTANDFGLNAPRARVIVEHSISGPEKAAGPEQGAEAQETRRRELVIGNASADGFYASLDGDGVCLISHRLFEILTTLLVDRSVLMLEAEQIQSLRVTTPRGTWEFERLGMALVQRSGTPELSPERLLELLDALGMLRAEAAVSLGEATTAQGRDQPTLALDVKLLPERFSAPVERRLRIGRADLYRDFGIYYGWREGQRGVFALPQGSVRRVLDAL